MGDLHKLIDEIEIRALRVQSAAVYLDTHPSYVRRLADQGRLTPLRVFGTLVFDKEELTEVRIVRQERRERIERGRQAKERACKLQPQGYHAWTVRDLKAELRHRGGSLGGNKAELVARLEQEDGNFCSSK